MSRFTGMMMPTAVSGKRRTAPRTGMFDTLAATYSPSYRNVHPADQDDGGGYAMGGAGGGMGGMPGPAPEMVSVDLSSQGATEPVSMSYEAWTRRKNAGTIARGPSPQSTFGGTNMTKMARANQLLKKKPPSIAGQAMANEARDYPPGYDGQPQMSAGSSPEGEMVGQQLRKTFNQAFGPSAAAAAPAGGGPSAAPGALSQYTPAEVTDYENRRQEADLLLAPTMGQDYSIGRQGRQALADATPGMLGAETDRTASEADLNRATGRAYESQGQAAIQSAGVTNQQMTQLQAENRRLQQEVQNLRRAGGTTNTPTKAAPKPAEHPITKEESRQAPKVGWPAVMGMRKGHAPGSPATQPSGDGSVSPPGAVAPLDATNRQAVAEKGWVDNGDGTFTNPQNKKRYSVSVDANGDLIAESIEDE